MTNDSDDNDKTTVISGQTALTLSRRIREEAPAAVVVISGPTAYLGRPYFLTESECFIGRSMDAYISIDDRSVSRNHARLELKDNQVTITDLGASNPTVINRQTLSPNIPFELKGGDEIKCGRVVLKFFEKGNADAHIGYLISLKISRDNLTGLFTKEALLERASKLIKSLKKEDPPFCILVLDIDYFKKINDEHGHLVGDKVLQEFGYLCLNQLIRSEDFMARYGGEEFVLILQSTHLAVAAEVAERIRAAVEKKLITLEQKNLQFTISIGVAEHRLGESWSAVFERADAALYAAKREGRNRVKLG